VGWRGPVAPCWPIRKEKKERKESNEGSTYRRKKVEARKKQGRRSAGHRGVVYEQILCKRKRTNEQKPTKSVKNVQRAKYTTGYQKARLKHRG